MNRMNMTLATLAIATLPLIGCGHSEYRYDPASTTQATCRVESQYYKYRRVNLDCGEQGRFSPTYVRDYAAITKTGRARVEIQQGYRVDFDSDGKEIARVPIRQIVSITP